MNAYNVARRLAHCGYATLPIRHGDKMPDFRLAPKGVYSASTDPSVHLSWFHGVDRNIAIAVPAGVVVVDIDPRNGGIETMTALVRAHGSLPKGPRQVSGGGGIHLLFQRPEDAQLRGKLTRMRGDEWIYKGVDLLCAGKYFLCAPSIHKSGKRYVWTRPPWESDLPPVPMWLRDLMMEDPPPEPKPAPTMKSSDVIKRAMAYLAKCEPAVSGQGGHATTFKVACAIVRGFNIDEATAFELLKTYNARCAPPWSERALMHKIKQASKRGKEAFGELLNETKQR